MKPEEKPTEKFTSDVLQQIASFFAERCNNPQLAFQLANCSGSSTCGDTASCCCGCAGPCGNDMCGP